MTYSNVPYLDTICGFVYGVAVSVVGVASSYTSITPDIADLKAVASV